MAYKLNKTDGSVLTDLIDGILDTDTTDLALVGRNFTGFGEFINENFIKLLENFSNPNEPLTPLKGQIWYDTTENKLKVFDGESFQSASGAFSSDTQPTTGASGDTWFNTVTKQFYLFDGNEWTLVGPSYTQQQGTSGFVIDTIFDNNLTSKTVLKVFIGDALQAVIAAEEFTPNPLPTNIVQGLVDLDTNPGGRIFKGINLIDKENFKYLGTAQTALSISTGIPGDAPVPATRLLRNDRSGIIDGGLSLKDPSGLRIGTNDETAFIVFNGLKVENTQAGQSSNMNFIVRPNAVDPSESAIKVDAPNRRVGIFQETPGFNLDVTGDARITGNLTVEGTSFTTSAETVEIADKNIELGVTDSPSDLTAHLGGITLKGATDKTFNWSNVTSSWTSSENLDLASGKVIKHNGANLLSSTRLYDTVTQATGITRVGTLTELTVDNIRLDTNTISRISGSGLTINANSGDINVSSSNIVQLAAPTEVDHATTKDYVDKEVANEVITFSFDTTGYASPNDRIIDVLDVVYPASDSNATGKKARIVCTNYDAIQSTDAIDVATASSTTEVSVNAAAGGTVSVLTGINLPNSLQPNFTLNINREIRFFVINALGNWEVDSSEAQNPLNIT